MAGRPPPALERACWSRRVPLSDVVSHDRWPVEDAGAPAAPPSHLRAPGREAVGGNATVAAALACGLLDADPAEAVGPGAARRA